MSLMGERRPTGERQIPGAILPPDLTCRSAIRAVISYPMASRPRTANRRLLARLISGPASVSSDRGLAINLGTSSGLTMSPTDLPIWAGKLRAWLSAVTLWRCAPAVRGTTAALNRRQAISLAVQS